MTTLADIVNASLSDAESRMKLASARDTKPAGGSLDFLDAELVAPKIAAEDTPYEADARPDPKSKKDKGEKDEKKDKEEEKSSSVIADASYAMKLAEALTLGANIVAAKLASGRSPLDAPGPAVHESGMQHRPTAPRAHSKVTPTISGPAVQGPNGLPTDKADFTSQNDHSGRAHNHPGKTASWTQSQEGTAQVLRAKVAQAEVLISMGQTAAAEVLLNEVQRKVAQDPSSPQPSMPGHSESFRLSTEPGESSHIPENAALISMTRAQAKDKTTREVSQYISEPPKKDNAVAAHTLRTDGQKLSSAELLKTAAQKTAKSIQHDEKFQGRLAGGLLGVQGAALGGVTGAAVHEAAGDAVRQGSKSKILSALAHHPKKTIAGGVLALGAAGAAGGRSLGRWGARKQKEHDEEVARMHAKATKEAGLDPALGRAYLQKLIKTASDPEAMPAEHTKAAEALQAIKAKLGVDPDALLS